MSVATICDRCHSTRADGATVPGWSKVTVQPFKVDAQPPDAQRSLDLCPSCSSALNAMLEPARETTRKAGKK